MYTCLFVYSLIDYSTYHKLMIVLQCPTDDRDIL